MHGHGHDHSHEHDRGHEHDLGYDDGHAREDEHAHAHGRGELCEADESWCGTDDGLDNCGGYDVYSTEPDYTQAWACARARGQVEKLFSMLDVDEDGCVTRKELAAKMQSDPDFELLMEVIPASVQTCGLADLRTCRLAD